jgi:2-amino-4-hydroxy-6-hydroxymethyldihydropteridine diphosphokinase
MIEVGLSLGSNLGRRLSNLRQARSAVLGIPGVELAACSPAYETQPVDVAPQHRRRRFLNAVLILRCAMDVGRLAGRLHAIERRMGRVRGRDRNAPRPIDLDVIYAGRRRLCTPRLRIPHPLWAGRRFVVQPLADVRPPLVLPGQTLSVRALLSALPVVPKVVLYKRRW